MRSGRPAHGTRPDQRHDVVGSITRRRCPWFEAGPAASDRLVDIVNTPTRSPAAPSEMPPAGRRWATRPLLQFFERSFQRCNRGYVVVAEPSSDTPVVMPPGMLSGLPGQAQACMPQAASTLTVPRGGGFLFQRCSAGIDGGRGHRKALESSHTVRQPGRIHELIADAWRGILAGGDRSRTSPISQEPGVAVAPSSDTYRG
jgi:hypothetical protein